MKILVVTQNAPLYLPEFMDALLARLAAAGHTTRVALLSPKFRRNWRLGARDRLALYGWRDFVRMTLRVAVRGALARLPARWRGERCWSVRNAAARHRADLWTAASVNDPAFVARVRSEEIDLVVSVASPQMFRAALLSAPRLGCLNYHTSLLPRHRGRQPLFWAAYEGDAETGVSVHEMNERLDDGPILVQVRVPIAPGDTIDRLYWKTMAVGVDALVRAVEMKARGDANRRPNPADQATTHRFPTAAEARAFRARGGRFL